MAHFNFENLTSSVRLNMISEIDLDIKNEQLYISKRLTEEGKLKYPISLREAALNNTEKELAEDLRVYIKNQEEVNGKMKKIPSNASTLLSQSEFNRFYIRAICLEAINKGEENIEVYRARVSSWSRVKSEVLIEKIINANELLIDLRENIGSSPELLPEINLGLSVRLIE